MIKSTLFVFITVLHLFTDLVKATSSTSSNPDKQQGKRLKLDLNFPPPEEEISQVNSHHLDTNLHLGIESAANQDIQTACDYHHPGCTHWKSIPVNERRKLYYRWRRKTRTTEERVAYNAASRIRGNKRYRNMTKEQKQARVLQGTESRAKRLKGMNENEKKDWYKKNNSYRRKPKQPKK